MSIIDQDVMKRLEEHAFNLITVANKLVQINQDLMEISQSFVEDRERSVQNHMTTEACELQQTTHKIRKVEAIDGI